jgi:hypothetical protein
VSVRTVCNLLSGLPPRKCGCCKLAYLSQSYSTKVKMAEF